MSPLWRARVRLVVELAVVVYLVLGSWAGRVEQRNNSVAGCERSKLDRADNAAGWTAHRIYIGQVTAAASVKEDVKSAARTASVTYRRISAGLNQRARIDCAAAFPKPSLLP